MFLCAFLVRILTRPSGNPVEIPTLLHNMGFFTSCLEQLLRLAALTPFNPFEDIIQQPLLGFGDLAQVPFGLSPGSGGDTIIHPEHASPSFKCVYPKR